MAVAPTGAIYKALKFDGVSSRTYGVYITGEAVYNAPERDVEMITIPGRNGSFALDNGRFENITVTYPAGIFAETEADFREAISEFRNFLCSRKGYVRLQDEYNPNEYRMAVYKSGLEVEPAMLKAGEFEITFDCKPQRWLTSGETAVTIANSGDTITNPTLFNSGPLLEVEGYGDININDSKITIENTSFGNIQLRAAYTSPTQWIPAQTVLNDLNVSELNPGDEIYFPEIKIVIDFTTTGGQTITQIYDNNRVNVQSAAFSVLSSTNGRAEYTLPAAVFYYGTPATTPTSEAVAYVDESNPTAYHSFHWTMYAEYDGDQTITIKRTNLGDVPPRSGTRMTIPEIMGKSTKMPASTSIFIDLDLGEAWNDNNGSIVSANNAVYIPAKLPELAPGANTITFDNTITDLKITPRWWKV